MPPIPHFRTSGFFKTHPSYPLRGAAELPSFCLPFCNVPTGRFFPSRVSMIIVIMCIHCKDNLLPSSFCAVAQSSPVPPERFSWPPLSQRAIHKIILHVNHQQFLHFSTIPFHPAGMASPQKACRFHFLLKRIILHIFFLQTLLTNQGKSIRIRKQTVEKRSKLSTTSQS